MPFGMTAAQERRAVETYTALHEGLPPREFLRERLPSKPRTIWHLGRGSEIQYIKRIPSEVPRFHHPWAEQARPLLGVDQDGQLWIYAGRYETTRRGIEDRVSPGMATVEYLAKPYVQRERLPLGATHLTTLGKLEWIKYKYLTDSGDEREGILRWSSQDAPDVAHDQHGNLVVLGGHYRITERGVEQMALSNPRRSRRRRRHANPSRFSTALANPRHKSRSRRRSRRGHARRNPSGMVAYSNPTRSISVTTGNSTQRAYRMIMNSVVVGGVAVVSAVAINMGLDKWGSTLSPQIKAGIKVGVGLAVGIGAAALIRDPRYYAIPAGISVGGVFSGLSDLWSLYVAPRLAALMAPAAPGAGALLPGGLPQGYQAYSPQACAVG